MKEQDAPLSRDTARLADMFDANCICDCPNNYDRHVIRDHPKLQLVWMTEFADKPPDLLPDNGVRHGAKLAVMFYRERGCDEPEFDVPDWWLSL